VESIKRKRGIAEVRDFDLPGPGEKFYIIDSGSAGDEGMIEYNLAATLLS
jgi:hypothetical protein